MPIIELVGDAADGQELDVNPKAKWVHIPIQSRRWPLLFDQLVYKVDWQSKTATFDHRDIKTPESFM